MRGQKGWVVRYAALAALGRRLVWAWVSSRLLGWMPPARARARALLVAATAAVLIRPLLSAVNLPCALSCMPSSTTVHSGTTPQYLLTGPLTLLDLVRLGRVASNIIVSSPWSIRRSKVGGSL